jgi:hypothetical protein
VPQRAQARRRGSSLGSVGPGIIMRSLASLLGVIPGKINHLVVTALRRGTGAFLSIAAGMVVARFND